MQVCYPTTPANYFHLLRRQVKQDMVRPLIVMTPKSLLRLPEASSTIEDLTNGGFQPVIDDATADKLKVKRIVVASGKVYYDLEKAKKENVAVIRLEQFYPFPKAKLVEILASYPNAESLVWCQEEPRNMGGWVFVRSRFEEIKGKMSFQYVGRVDSASPATGSYAIHGLEQAKLVEEAMTI
jgi:2-oxoglutarate dehydrogenase E1 component